MKLIILMSVLTWVAASQLPPVAIISQSMEMNPDGSYKSSFEAENGIKVDESGYIKQIDPENAGTASRGSYEYAAPDGSLVKVEWIADENGFQPSGDHLPVAPPMPEHVVKLLADLHASGVQLSSRTDSVPPPAPIRIAVPVAQSVLVAPVPVRTVASSVPSAPVASVPARAIPLAVSSVPVAPVPVKTVAPPTPSVPVAPVPARTAAPAIHSVPVAPAPVKKIQTASTVPGAVFESKKISVSSAPGSKIQATAFTSAVPARNVQPPRTPVASIPSVPAVQAAPLISDQIVLPARTLQLPLLTLSAPMPDNVIKFLSSKANPTYFPGH